MVHRQNHSTGERFRWSKIGSQVTSPTLPCKSECPLEWSESRYCTFQLAEYLVVYSQSSLYCHHFLPLSCLPPVLPPLSLDLCRLTASLWEVKGRWQGGVPSLRHNQILPTHPDWQPMLPWHNPPSVPMRLTYPLTLNMVCLSCSLASMNMILPPGIPSAHPDLSLFARANSNVTSSTDPPQTSLPLHPEHQARSRCLINTCWVSKWRKEQNVHCLCCLETLIRVTED